MRTMISKNELIQFLMDFDFTQIGSISTRTQPVYKKTGRVSGLTMEQAIGSKPENIFKFSDYTFGIGYEYTDSMQNRIIKAGGKPEDYIAGKSYTTPVEGTRNLRTNSKGEYLLELQQNTANKPKSKFFDVTNGKEISKEILTEFLPVPQKNVLKIVVDGKDVEIEKPPILTPKIENIESIRLQHNEYVIIK